MPGDTDLGRTYTDREVRLILKSAVELQQRRDQGADPSGGMSLAELEQVAVEAGLDPTLIRRAAAELDTVGPPPDHNAFLGSPTHVVIERVADAPIHPEAFDQLLDVTRAVTREVGEVSTVGRQFGWKGRLDGARAEVSASADDRRTTLRVRVNFDELAVGHFMLKGMFVGGLGGLASTVAAVDQLGPIGAIVGAVVVGSGYLWSRWGLKRDATRYAARARELVDALTERTRAVAAERDRIDAHRPASLPNA